MPAKDGTMMAKEALFFKKKKKSFKVFSELLSHLSSFRNVITVIVQGFSQECTRH